MGNKTTFIEYKDNNLFIRLLKEKVTDNEGVALLPADNTYTLEHNLAPEVPLKGL